MTLIANLLETNEFQPPKQELACLLSFFKLDKNTDFGIFAVCKGFAFIPAADFGCLTKIYCSASKNPTLKELSGCKVKYVEIGKCQN